VHLSAFLKYVHKDPDLSGIFVVSFQGSEYPLIFLFRFFSRLKVLNPHFSSLDSQEESIEAQAGLTISFLGMRMLYWLKNVAELTATQKKEWMKFIQGYEGPHCIFYFEQVSSSKKTTDTVDAEQLHIELPQTIDRELYQEIYSFLYPDTPLEPHFVFQLFRQGQTLSLEEACLCMAYQTVVGKKCEAFFEQWFSHLVVPQKSLFALSQSFFAQQPKAFLAQWKACKDSFPDEFWIAYWSEQLWQASLFVGRALTQGVVEAKKGTYRLPFSFLNKDWQRYSLEQLAQSHDMLYRLDYSMKNGTVTYGLEVWYHQFLRMSRA
jgi:hypothetical protein